MDYNKRYEILASQLGDIMFKIMLLEQEKSKLLAAILELNNLAGQPHETQDQTPKDDSTRSSGSV